jgi:pimeloyl-ACP methyl ester carboxylesterase
MPPSTHTASFARTHAHSSTHSTSARRHRGARHRTSSSSPRLASAANDKSPVVILPGLGNASEDYDELVSLVRARGHVVQVADVKRIDWLRNAAGAVTPEYWRGTLAPRPTVDWYLTRVRDAVQEVRRDDGNVASSGSKVTLLAHSAGGWLARVYLDAFDDAGEDVGALVTLGSPMKPTPKDVPGVIDQTRGILDWVADNCRKCDELSPGISVTCVAGTYKRGSDSITGGAQAFACGLGYKQVCGDANVEGDGITPVDTALMDGAEHIVLEGVYHTPLGSNSSERKWYGSPDIFDAWAARALP